MQQLWNGITTLITGVPTIVPGSISAFVALIAFYFAMKNYHRSPLLTVTVFGDNIGKTIYFILPFAEDALFAIPLRILIRNIGHKTAKNVNVVVEAPDSLYQHQFERKIDKVSIARRVQIAADTTTGTQVALAYYAIPEIHRNTATDINDFIFASGDTIMRSTVDATTADGVPVKIPYTLLLSNKLKISISAEDIRPLTFESSIHLRKGKDNEINVAINNENSLIRDIINKTGRIDEKEITLITFKEFIEKPVSGSSLIVFEGNRSSMVGRNARITSDGLQNQSSYKSRTSKNGNWASKNSIPKVSISYEPKISGRTCQGSEFEITT